MDEDDEKHRCSGEIFVIDEYDHENDRPFNNNISGEWIPVDDQGNPLPKEEKSTTKSSIEEMIRVWHDNDDDDTIAKIEDDDDDGDFDPDYEDALRENTWNRDSELIRNQNKPSLPPHLIMPSSIIIEEEKVKPPPSPPSPPPPPPPPPPNDPRSKITPEQQKLCDDVYAKRFESSIGEISDFLCYLVYVYMMSIRILCYRETVNCSLLSAKLMLSSIGIMYSSLILFLSSVMILMVPMYATHLAIFYEVSPLEIVSFHWLFALCWLCLWISIMYLNQLFTRAYLKLIWVNGHTIESEYTKRFGEMCAGVIFVRDFIQINSDVATESKKTK